jgi:hypothetical protein
MARKRPCAICGRWFAPTPQTKGRQAVCRETECQRERHRRACRGWHDRNPDYDRDRRLRARLHVAEEKPARAAPPGELPPEWWRVVRDADSLEAAVILEEFGRVLSRLLRDADMLDVHGTTEDSARVLPPVARDESDPPQAPP